MVATARAMAADQENIQPSAGLSPKAPTIDVVLDPPPVHTNAERLGEWLSPRTISRVLWQADVGNTCPLHDLLNEIRQKDPVVHSLLQTREKALTACGWAIVPNTEGAAEGSPEWEQAQKVASFCSSAVAATRGLERAIEHLVDGIYKGFAVLEIVWRKAGTTLTFDCLEARGGRRFAYGVDQRLYWYEPNLPSAPFPGIDFRAEFPNKFVVHAPRVNGDEPTREGLGRLIVWYACFRTWSWRDWMLFSELYGKPRTDVTYEKDSVEDDDRKVAEGIARQSTSRTATVHPDSVKVSVNWPTATGGAQSSPSPAILKQATEELSLAVLGQLGTTGSVQNGLGGKGDARENVRKDLLRSDERQVNETLRYQLLAPLVLFKFGSLQYLPTWSFNTQDTEDSEATMRAFTLATKLGMKIPMRFAHEVTGWPAANDEEQVLAAPAAPVLSGAAEEEGPEGPPKDPKAKKGKQAEEQADEAA